MNKHDLFRGIGDIGDEMIESAAPQKGTRKSHWLPIAAAACLVLVIAAAAVTGGLGKDILKKPEDTAVTTETPCPTVDGGAEMKNLALYTADYPDYPDRLNTDRDAYHTRVAEINPTQPSADYLAGLGNFSVSSVRQILAVAGTENRVFSPLNLYMALSMLAEVTGGNTRGQILDLLGADSVETIRAETENIWRSVYVDNGVAKTLPATSFWLDSSETYKDEVLEILSRDYFASSYSGNMGTDEFDAAMQAWINEQTGGVLQDEAAQLTTNSDSYMLLISTLYFYDQWAENGFHEGGTAPGTFTLSDGAEVTCDFMHGTVESGYLAADGYRSASLKFENGCSMTFILPDEGYSVDDMLSSDALEYVLLSSADDSAYQTGGVEFTVPKFTVSCSLDLKDSMRSLGVTEVFDQLLADFSPLTDYPDTWLQSATQAAMVTVDEKGCTASSFVELDIAEGSGEDEVFEMKLDRSFIFIITGLDGLPLYTGVVNNPNG